MQNGYKINYLSSKKKEQKRARVYGNGLFEKNKK